MGYYGQLEHNQPTRHHESEGAYHPHIQQQMGEAVVAAVNYVYYMTYISHYAAFMEQTIKGA